MNAARDDVVAVEVHHKALENITNEMSIALVRTSGSPVVTDSKDFAACLLDTVPEHLSVAAYVLGHFGTSLVGTQLVADIARGLDDVRPGDGWIVNDSYRGGANHQGDVSIIMPFFHRNTHVGWGFTDMHMLDIGGSGVSGIAPGAHDVYGEGLRFAGVRAIRNGGISPEWEEFIATNVRMAGPVLNDLRSQIAAINIGGRKLSELVEQIGLERHERLCELHKDMTEEMLRARIARIPNGRYEAIEWNEFDGHGPDLLQELKVILEVDDTDLRFTYLGAPQIDAFVNAGYGAVLGSVIVSVLTSLGYGDVPLNGGVWRTVHVSVGEPGTIVSPVEPAPVSMGHSETGMRVRKLARDVISQAVALSDDPVLRSRLSGKAGDGPAMGPILFGPNQHGGRSVIVYLDTTLTGGGAATIHDGQDAYGTSAMTGSGLPDAERHEAADPVLFLWRRVSQNSGGPGQFRGGQGLDQAYRMEYVDAMSGPSFVVCAEVPASGIGGGYPGSGGGSWVVRSGEPIDVPALRDAAPADRFRGQRALPSKLPYIEIERGDTVVATGGGGGGVGDPLLRKPALVASDVNAGYITAEHGHAAYGVVLTAGGTVDAAATEAKRLAIRCSRIGREPARDLVAPDSVGVSVVRGDDAGWMCGSCAESLAEQGQNWREDVVAVENEIGERYAELHMYVKPRLEEPRIVIREYFCPTCAQALVVDVVTEPTPTLETPVLAATASETTRELVEGPAS